MSPSISATRASIAAREAPATFSPKATFCATVRFGKSA